MKVDKVAVVVAMLRCGRGRIAVEPSSGSHDRHILLDIDNPTHSHRLSDGINVAFLMDNNADIDNLTLGRESVCVRGQRS